MRYLLGLAALVVLLPYASVLSLYVHGGLHYDPARHGQVVLLSTASCPYCVRMRAYLRAGGVPYRELDVEHDPEGRRRFRASGAVGVPVLLVGAAVVEGYHPAAIRAAFADAGPRPPAPAANAARGGR
jgi:glutaredoxin 3